MANALAVVGILAVVLALIWPYIGQKYEVVTSVVAPMLPDSVPPTALGIANELIGGGAVAVGATTFDLLKYGVDPQYRMAFPYKADYRGKLVVHPLRDDAELVAMSIRLNPELAAAAARWKV